MASTSTLQVAERLPAVVRDARFRAGRKLVESGHASSAVEVFATLLAESRKSYGDDHLETAAAYYEYGNAILRHTLGDKNHQDIQQKRDTAANAAERRATGANEPTASEAAGKTQDGEADVGSKEGDQEDSQIALEMMETAWSILDASMEDPKVKYAGWVEEQLPRVLIGIGDVLSLQGRHADSVDAYLRALPYRQSAVEALTNNKDETGSPELLHVRRLLVETFVLIAQELLDCPPGQDVVTSESQDTLVKTAERIEYARGYYDKARDELQETVLLMGQLAAKGVDHKEKEDICFVATLVMGVGETLAAIDEEEEGQKPKAKKLKK